MPDSLYMKQRASASDRVSLLLPERELNHEMTWIEKEAVRYPMNKNDRIYFLPDTKQ